jgi:4-amino-4-deoxy-L-arabinose transferase-like glycosyltransferase
MTTPPRKADDPPAARTRNLRTLLVVALIFALVFLLQPTLLNLPYEGEEAVYFIPTAGDIYAGRGFVPHPAQANAPLLGFYLGLAWTLFDPGVAVTRASMLLMSALALLGTFRLGVRVGNTRVAAAVVLCTAVYPVFFAQSTLAHPDMMVTALTLWALMHYLPRTATGGGDEGEAGASAGVLENTGVRRALCIFLLALAALAKETAALVPLALCGWELLCRLARENKKLAAAFCVGGRRSVAWSLALLLALVPLSVWLAYQSARTGDTFGDPEYFRRHVGSMPDLSRTLGALWTRLQQVTWQMNLWVLTLAGLASMLLKPRRDGAVERPRIAVPVQLLFAALILAHVIVLSIDSGALPARHMLPVLPLVVLVWVSTLWRRVRCWPLVVALVCAVFAYTAHSLCLTNSFSR